MDATLTRVAGAVVTTAEVAARIGRDRPQTAKLLRRHSIRPVGRKATGRQGYPPLLWRADDAEWLAAVIGPKGKPRGRRQ